MMHGFLFFLVLAHTVPSPVKTIQAAKLRVQGPQTAMSQHERVQWYLQLIQVSTVKCKDP